jgi:hypothetical protein
MSFISVYFDFFLLNFRRSHHQILKHAWQTLLLVGSSSYEVCTPYAATSINAVPLSLINSTWLNEGKREGRRLWHGTVLFLNQLHDAKSNSVSKLSRLSHKQLAISLPHGTVFQVKTRT